MKDEINHLLLFVEKTRCLYERNGKLHNGKDAAKHIRKKYDYYKGDIDSTEKFIELSATKSMMSGEFYMIECQGEKKLKSRDWLLNELSKYRETKS